MLKGFMKHFVEEREFLISLFGKKHRQEKWKEWIIRVKEEFVTPIDKIWKGNMKELQKIKVLQEGIKILEQERSLLKSSVLWYNPNQKRTMC